MATSARRADHVAPAAATSGPVRLWGLPLWAHLAAYAALLLALVPLLRLDAAFTSDEGAYAIQVHRLDRGSWVDRYALADVDPDGDWYPFVNSVRGDGGWYLYAKHPLYPVAQLAAVRAVGEVAGLHLLPLVAALGVAAAAWLLAAEVDGRMARPAFWLVALGPVLVNAHVVWAHVPMAAVAGAAFVAGARVVTSGVTIGRVAVLGGGLALAVLLRAEGLLVAAGLAPVLGVVRWRRAGFGAGVAAAAAAGLAPLAAVAVERWWVGTIVGVEIGTQSVRQAEGSFLAGRATGAWWTLFAGGFERVASLVVVVLLAVLGWAAVAAARDAGRRGALPVALLAAAGLGAVRLAVAPTDPVPALFAAWPLAFAGLLLWRPGSAVERAMAASAGLTAIAVLATQYPEGGGFEWGGRFLLGLSVPVAVLAVAGLRRALPSAGAPGAGLAVPAAGAVLVVFAVAGATILGQVQRRHDRVVGLVDRTATAAGAPVVVTTSPALPRLAWRLDPATRFLLVDEGERGDALRALAGAGTGRALLVGTAGGAPPDAGPGATVTDVTPEHGADGLTYHVVELSPP